MALLAVTEPAKAPSLKILSRITEPTNGRVILSGRVASLLEVGTGFHPELTGRENVFLNGAVLGMTQREVRTKFDEIVAFAEVEKFLDTPVKYYSSGMYVRLAFAVAAHLEPEILLVDEVLAVGDAEFQKKCLGKMEEVAHGGKTVVLVSHNVRAVQQLCTSSVVLSNGSVKMLGGVSECLESYLSSGSRETEGYVDLLAARTPRNGSGECRFRSFELVNSSGERTGRFRFGESIVVNVSVESDSDIGEVVLGFSFFTRLLGYEIMGTVAHDGGSRSAITKGKNEFSCEVSPMILNPGVYFIRAAIFKIGQTFDHIDEVMEFEVEDAAADASLAPKSHYVGDVYVPYRWTDRNLRATAANMSKGKNRKSDVPASGLSGL